MSTADARSGATSGTAGVKNADMKMEMVVAATMLLLAN